MSVSKKRNTARRIVDAAMTVVLLFLMAYQVTGEAAHEWIGVSMTILVIVHQILNRKWYGALFKGKYNPYRILTTVLSILLVLCFAMTAFCGMSMSGYAVPFMYGLAPVSFVRRMHLSMSHWAFVLMGLHLGVHIPAMTAGLKWSDRTRNTLIGLSTLAAGLGLYLFIRNGMPDYLFFRVPFAFLDYDKAGWLVIVENLLMLSTWVLIGTRAAQLCRALGRLGVSKENHLVPVVCIMAAVIIGMLFVLAGLSAGKSTLRNEKAFTISSDFFCIYSPARRLRSIERPRRSLCTSRLKPPVKHDTIFRIAENESFSLNGKAAMDVGYYRKGMWMGIKACLGIAAFILVFGAIMAIQFHDWTNLLIVAGCDAVFLLITFVVFKLALSAEDPHESYEMSDIYVKSGYGRSSVYFDFDKAKAAVFTPKYIELQNGIKKLRVFVPEEDYDFVKRYIMNRLTGECEIRYES